MSTIDDLYQAVSKLNLKDELPLLIRDNGNEAAKLVETQLIQGKLSTGASITPSYAEAYYSKKKNAMNSAPGYGVPDLKVTGDYYAGIGLAIISDTEYAIESDVPYAKNASIEQYGPQLLALSEENKTKFAEETLFPAISAYINNKTGLEFV